MSRGIYKRKSNSNNVPAKIKPFVVYVTFPNSTKEYSYLCDLPGIRQGSIVIANGCEVVVRRTAEFDDNATKWVQSRSTFDTIRRTNQIRERLRILAAAEEEIARFKKLKSPEAKRLLKELESL